jgi:uncharacterized protein (TIGR03086 family)
VPTNLEDAMRTVVDQIEQAIDATAGIVNAIGEAQLSLPTPCAGWSVRTELNHVVGGMRIFTAELTETAAGAEHEADWLGADPWTAYAQAATADRQAWRAPGALDRTVHISLGALPGPMAAVIHLTEVLVHGVDLAVATGREDLVDDQQCKELLVVMHEIGGVDPYRVPGVFGPEVTVPDGAPVHRQLLAYLGRTV